MPPRSLRPRLGCDTSAGSIGSDYTAQSRQAASGPGADRLYGTTGKDELALRVNGLVGLEECASSGDQMS